MRMTQAISSTLLLPPEFGFPHMFQSNPYTYYDDLLQSSSSKSGLSSGVKIGIGVGVAVAALVFAGVCTYVILQKRCAEQTSKQFSSWGSASGGDSGDGPKLKGARRFTLAELKKATNAFSESNKIGSGGYGKVYKGELLTGEQVAVKRSDERSLQGAREFKNEVELLSRVHHKNVVSLVGYCYEPNQQMLVYDYMANGSLRDHLFGNTGIRLDWRLRVGIALGTARGIAYLHDLASPSIIHRDIKSNNILLDAKLNAKVADFGLSKVEPGEGTGKGYVTTQVKGTVGYLDPEYFLSQQLTKKSDVYSYGVVLLEMITARAPIERGTYIVREVKAVAQKEGLPGVSSMLDPRMKYDSTQSLEMEKFLSVALRCVEENSSDRPTMSEVVKELEELVIHHKYFKCESSSRADKVDEGLPCHPNKRRLSGSDLSDTTPSSKDSSLLFSGESR